MSSDIAINGPHKNFETIKKLDENGVECWFARDLMPLFGYDRWENFEKVVQKGAQAAMRSNQTISDHFRKVKKMVDIGSNTVREITDWKLDRYACYLIAQNGDSQKKEIALAQTYFAIQARKQELFDQLPYDQKRLITRNQVVGHNKQLFKTAKKAGVTKFGLFNDAGYRGLYEMPLKDLEKKKGVKKGELLDRAGGAELAANLFRITQTDDKLKKDKISGQQAASQTHFMVGGKVRQTIKDIGGAMPEHLPMEKHVKLLKREFKKISP